MFPVNQRLWLGYRIDLAGAWAGFGFQGGHVHTGDSSGAAFELRSKLQPPLRMAAARCANGLASIAREFDANGVRAVRATAINAAGMCSRSALVTSGRHSASPLRIRVPSLRVGNEGGFARLLRGGMFTPIQ